jgi:hypothetical protein
VMRSDVKRELTAAAGGRLGGKAGGR